MLNTERIVSLEAQVEPMAAEVEEQKMRDEEVKRKKKSRPVPQRPESLYKEENVEQEVRYDFVTLGLISFSFFV